MKKLYNEMLTGIGGDFLMEHTEKLWKCEFGQTFASYHKAADYTFNLMKSAGIPETELKMYTADGKTCYNDVRMPLAWDATEGRLTLLNPTDTFVSGVYGAKKKGNTVVADYKKHPFHLIKGSVSTPPEGLEVTILTEQQFLAGDNAGGALVMLEPFTHFGGATLRAILDRGGIGYITDRISGRYEHLESISWINAGTEGRGWHVFAGDRPFISFSVSPKTGDMIRNAAKTRLRARIECDGKRYSGELPLVTGLIPGKKREEVWIYAHMYEPLSNDDANGVVAGIETARRIMERGTPEYSIRLLFAMELYGYMAYVAEQGNFLRDKVIGGCNFDALGCVENAKILCFPSPDGTPFFGNYILQQLVEELAGSENTLEAVLKPSTYFDDMSVADPSIGVPSVWPIGEFGDCHHCSIQTMSFLNRDVFRMGCAFNSALIEAFANPKEEQLVWAGDAAVRNLEKACGDIRRNPFGNPAAYFQNRAGIERRKLEDFKRVFPVDKVEPFLHRVDAFIQKAGSEFTDMPLEKSLWRKAASEIVVGRRTAGFPHNLARVPAEKYHAMPDGVIYGHMANIIAGIDGKRDLSSLIREAEYERGVEIAESSVRRYVNAVEFLADYGYFEVVKRPSISKAQMISSLRTLGVKEGDTLLIHSSTGNCGYIEGGAQTILDALFECAGKSGTLLFPTFTRPYIFLQGVNRNWDFRPYDPLDFSQICTGNIPVTLLREYSGVLRSQHITHSWAGCGPLAEECLFAHAPDDPPASLNSPMGKAMEHGAKILHFGSSIATTTFLHMIETVCDAPFLDSAFCQIKTPNGILKNVLIEKHLPGHRDYYCGFQAFYSKFYSKAVEKGLVIHHTPLGVGELLLMDSKQLFEIGCELVRSDSRILLCDDPACVFCRNFQWKIRGQADA